jgi:hypothetical protein
MKMIDTLVVYQENGLTGELLVEVPAGLSNTEFLTFIHASLGETASIVNLINLDNVNRQKPVQTEGTAKPAARPERKSDSRPRFGGGESRPYGWRGAEWYKKDDKPTGWYAGRSPRDGARAPRAGFGSRPSRWDSRDSKKNGYEVSKSRSKAAPSRGR